MSIMTILGIFLVAWGLATGAVGLFRPEGLWRNPKIQGFVQLMGEQGAAIFLIVVGLAALVGGILILL